MQKWREGDRVELDPTAAKFLGGEWNWQSFGTLDTVYVVAKYKEYNLKPWAEKTFYALLAVIVLGMAGAFYFDSGGLILASIGMVTAGVVGMLVVGKVGRK